MNLGDSIRHGAKWLLGGRIASEALQFAVGVILARLLLPADFGTLVTVQIYTGLAGFVAGGGMGQALIRAKEASLGDFKVVFTLQLAAGILIYALFFVTAPLFARWYDNPIYTDLLRVSAISFLLRPFSNVPSAWLIREMRFRQRVIIDMALAPIASIVSILLAWQHFGVWSLVIGGLTSMVLTIIAMFVVTPFRPAVRFDVALAKNLAMYGLKVTSNDFVGYVRSQTPNFFLGQLQGPAFVGLFNKADSLAKTPRMIATSAYDPVFRSLSKVQSDKDRSQYIYLRTVTLLAVYMLPCFIGLAWLAKPFISFFYGANWLPSSEPMAILSLMGLFACIGYPSGAVLAAQNWLGREIFVHLLQVVLFATSCVVGIRWGLSGVAWGILLSEGISVLFIALIVRRCLGMPIARLGYSLGPGLLLNTILCGALLLGDSLLPRGFRDASPFVYMLSMASLGASTYALAFLFLPIPSLASEALRWKTKIRAIIRGGWKF